jgi:hypothetical protein
MRLGERGGVSVPVTSKNPLTGSYRRANAAPLALRRAARRDDENYISDSSRPGANSVSLARNRLPINHNTPPTRVMKASSWNPRVKV